MQILVAIYREPHDENKGPRGATWMTLVEALEWARHGAGISFLPLVSACIRHGTRAREVERDSSDRWPRRIYTSGNLRTEWMNFSMNRRYLKDTVQPLRFTFALTRAAKCTRFSAFHWVAPRDQLPISKSDSLNHAGALCAPHFIPLMQRYGEHSSRDRWTYTTVRRE